MTTTTTDPSELERQAWETLSHHLGPLMEWLTSPTCTEVMVNPDGSVWVETHGAGMWRTDLVMDPDSRRTIVEVVATWSDKQLGDHDPEVGGTLPVLGARFQGLVPPAVTQAGFAIRLPSTRHIPIAEYVSSGVLTRAQGHVLAGAIARRQNILVAGGTGSGKTTFCNALLELLIHSNHRIMIIEDTPELRCQAPNVFPVHVNRQQGLTYQKALFVGLRLRPDRIVVGELRDGPATLEMLKAWNTGHNGGMSTIHSNSAEATLTRVEQLLEEVVAHAPKGLVAQAINVVVYLERYTDADGVPARRVRDVARVSYDREQHDYLLEHTFHPSL